MKFAVTIYLLIYCCLPVLEIIILLHILYFRRMLLMTWRWTMLLQVGCRCSMHMQLQCLKSSVTRRLNLLQR